MKLNKPNLRVVRKDEKLDLDTCKKILNQNGNNYTDKEIIQIRDYLYQLAETQSRHYKDWQTRQQEKVVEIPDRKVIPLSRDHYKKAG